MVEIISNFLQRTLTNLTLYDNDEATNSANESSTPSESTIIKFARFENGILRIFEAPINQTSYIAFSHVWGAWTWRTIAGIPYEVKASQEKADFIATDLPRIVGSGAFWMDTLTVDQRDEHEIAAIVDAIPVIFRSARKTIAVRECDGLYECCMDAVGDFDDHGEFHRRLYEHSRTHGEVLCVESYLQRLWTLQECLLSHTIEFYVASGSKGTLLQFTDMNQADVNQMYRRRELFADQMIWTSTQTSSISRGWWILSGCWRIVSQEQKAKQASVSFSERIRTAAPW